MGEGGMFGFPKIRLTYSRTGKVTGLKIVSEEDAAKRREYHNLWYQRHKRRQTRKRNRERLRIDTRDYVDDSQQQLPVKRLAKRRGNQKYLEFRASGYRFHRSVPNKLRPIIGKSSWSAKLFTHDRAEAELLIVPYIERTDKIIRLAGAGNYRPHPYDLHLKPTVFGEPVYDT